MRMQNEHLSEHLYGAINTPSVSVPSASHLKIVYLLTGIKAMMFSSQTGLLTWIDELENSVNQQRYKGSEKTFIYDHLEGEGQQEIRHSAVEVRRNPELMLKVLEEAYGQPPSLVKALELFLTERRGRG